MPNELCHKDITLIRMWVTENVVYKRLRWGMYNNAPPSAGVGGTPREELADKNKSRCNNIFLSVGNMYVVV
jgi:hypothetical protein